MGEQEAWWMPYADAVLGSFVAWIQAQPEIERIWADLETVNEAIGDAQATMEAIEAAKRLADVARCWPAEWSEDMATFFERIASVWMAGERV